MASATRPTGSPMWRALEVHQDRRGGGTTRRAFEPSRSTLRAHTHNQNPPDGRIFWLRVPAMGILQMPGQGLQDFLQHALSPPFLETTVAGEGYRSGKSCQAPLNGNRCKRFSLRFLLIAIICNQELKTGKV